MVHYIPVLSRDGTNQTLSGRELLNYFPAGESLVSDIPAGDGKIVNLFLQCRSKFTAGQTAAECAEGHPSPGPTIAYTLCLA